MLTWGEDKPRPYWRVPQEPGVYLSSSLEHLATYRRTRIWLGLSLLISGTLLFQGLWHLPAILVHTLTMGLAVRLLLTRMLYFNALEAAKQLRVHLDLKKEDLR